MTNRKAQILDELSDISIHLQYLPTSLNPSKDKKYFQYFERALVLRDELKHLDSGNLADSSPLASE